MTARPTVRRRIAAPASLPADEVRALELLRAPARRATQRAARALFACAGCGKCCTREYNSVRILPLEAAHLRASLATLPAARRAALALRARAAAAAFGLEAGAPGRRYDCPLQEPDGRCLLPLRVKPLACLSFGPRPDGTCHLDLPLYSDAYRALERRNTALGFAPQRRAIPVFLTDLDAPAAGPRRLAPVPERPKGAAAGRRVH